MLWDTGHHRMCLAEGRLWTAWGALLDGRVGARYRFSSAMANIIWIRMVLTRASETATSSKFKRNRCVRGGGLERAK